MVTSATQQATGKFPITTRMFWALDGGIRSITYNGGYANVHREVIAADFGIIVEATDKFSLTDQVHFSSVKQPGQSILPIANTLSTPSTAGSQTINYSGPLTTGNAFALPHGCQRYSYAKFLWPGDGCQ